VVNLGETAPEMYNSYCSQHHCHYHSCSNFLQSLSSTYDSPCHHLVFKCKSSTALSTTSFHVFLGLSLCLTTIPQPPKLHTSIPNHCLNSRLDSLLNTATKSEFNVVDPLVQGLGHAHQNR